MGSTSLRCYGARCLKRSNQFLEPLALRVENALPERGESVVTAAGIVFLGGRTLFGFLDEVRFDEALEGSVERGGPEMHLAGGAVEDILHDAVAVLFSGGEREHDVEPLRF